MIKGKRRKDVKAYSNSPKEGEVLFRAGTKVKVVKGSAEIDSVLHVYVEEIDDGEV